MLAHVAEAQGVVAAETLAGADTMPVDYDFVPRATYCHPQIGSFGYSEAQAKEKGYDVKTASFPFSANGKAMGLGDAVGLRQGRRRRDAQRDPRCAPHRPGRHRAAAGAHPRAEVGPHRRRGGAERLRAPHALRGGQGGRRGHRRPHDQLRLETAGGRGRRGHAGERAGDRRPAPGRARCRGAGGRSGASGRAAGQRRHRRFPARLDVDPPDEVPPHAGPDAALRPSSGPGLVPPSARRDRRRGSGDRGPPDDHDLEAGSAGGSTCADDSSRPSGEGGPGAGLRLPDPVLGRHSMHDDVPVPVRAGIRDRPASRGAAP